MYITTNEYFGQLEILKLPRFYFDTYALRHCHETLSKGHYEHDWRTFSLDCFDWKVELIF